jgi:cytochrome c-type biogenesis protein CcmF
MPYSGEHLWPGWLGHFFIILSFVASLVATFAFFKATSKNDLDNSSWKHLARGAFFVEAISVFSIFAILFYIISNHYFEYRYAWQHSSRSLETKYLLSCFWEGQEGSFLLWSFWHCVLGIIVIRTAKQWEAPVMTVVSFAQVCLATMVAGLYFFNYKLGSNPFVLLRNEGILDGAPAFLNENGVLRSDYLSLVKDGNDLNLLLQNYWMVIHPPVLFLGFASTTIPFAFAISGLWTKKFGDWISMALPWSLFSAAVLGTGIMMGGAWAYESLNFGGYWAWDPVENASLVPWLVLIGGIHTLLIYKHTGRSLRPTYFFFIASFCLVLYSTFLTRSGVLGDTSVHAFTDLGMNVQLLTFLLIFLIPAFTFYAIRYRQIPFIAKEEQTSSREFWMFIGSLVFFITATFISIMTSLPIFNKTLLPLVNGISHLFGSKTIAPVVLGEDTVYPYNRIVIFIAVIIALLTAVSQYLKYKQTQTKSFSKKILWPTVISIAIASLVIGFGNINYMDHGAGFLAAIWLALACSIYSIVANLAYIWVGMKGKLNLSGASVAHFGFGLMLVGILISSSKKEVLSYNTSGIFIPLGENRITGKAGENLTLVKGVRMDMGKYWVTYESKYLDELRKDKWHYRFRFQPKDGSKSFTLTPNAFVNKQSGDLTPNPDAKRYWTYDIFTYITSLPRVDSEHDTVSFKPYVKSIGDTIQYSNGFVTLDTILLNPSNKKYKFTSRDTALMAGLTVHSNDGPTYQVAPVLQWKNGQTIYIADTIPAQNLAFAFTGFVPPNHIELRMKESNSLVDYLTIKAYKFPFINLLWFGTVLMVVGFIISILRRLSLNKAADEVDNLKL